MKFVSNSYLGSRAAVRDFVHAPGFRSATWKPRSLGAFKRGLIRAQDAVSNIARLTLHVSRFTLHASRLTLHALRSNALTLLTLSLCAPTAFADTILGSKHDLSVRGGGTIKAAAETEVCIFCHTPHRAGELPLWNHFLSSATYTPYSSSTIRATVGQPSGASKLCLSCHDGTVALGMLYSRPTPIQMHAGVTTMPAGRSNLGTDLSDDHPVSFTYDSALASASGQLRDPRTLTSKVRLDHLNQMQCTSCHEPHDNQFGKFLVQENTGSALCLNCHNVNFWQTTVHASSAKTWNGSGPNPWPHTTRNTVSANGCENCHTSHAAGTPARLLTVPTEEQNCFSCHNGNLAEKNLQPEFNKVSTHPILAQSGVHDPAEDPVNAPRHIECVDCHNPHAAKAGPALAPNAYGALAGVVGVTSAGTLINPVIAEYELCFRCHADSIARGPSRVPRYFVETNKRQQFRTENASFHPVEAAGKNPNVPSLIAPLTTSSRIYCTDCHNNDQGPGALGAGPNGPHGSIYTPILERELVLADGNPESFSIYALCYKCHDRNSILADQSFKTVDNSSQDQHRGHAFHIGGWQGTNVFAACTTCHDSHGVQTQARLINFNTLYVSPSSDGRLEFNSTGRFSGNCSLTCHGQDGQNHDHLSATYGPFASPALKQRLKRPRH